MTELGATLQACTACHATWKQQVVDAPTWQRITVELELGYQQLFYVNAPSHSAGLAHLTLGGRL